MDYDKRRDELIDILFNYLKKITETDGMDCDIAQSVPEIAKVLTTLLNQ
mgnify:CR=1 FL=1